MTTQIFKSYDDFLNRLDKKINGVSQEFAKKNPDFEKDNETNIGCWDCSSCRSCSYCRSCRSKKNNGDQSNIITPESIPVIESIHQKILEAVSVDGALNMDSWHTCSTTHCRAGWVTFLAGEKGRELENKTSTLFAAMQIYKKSSPIPVSPIRFFEDNKTALADIKRCAELEEKKLSNEHL